MTSNQNQQKRRKDRKGVERQDQREEKSRL
jgi:hypothetical protein